VGKRLDIIVSKDLPVLIGDADGADRAIQLYLHGKHYRNVEVFCTEGICRNNVGAWEVRSVPARTRQRNAEFYSAKDRAMAQEATVGLMVWDGKSVGTLMNVQRLLGLRKKAVVYAVPEREFIEFRTREQWDAFVSRRSQAVREKLERRAELEAAGTGSDTQSHLEHS
jgi:hypothetical protein